MNKILGILLFVIIVVSSASVAFAYDPGVTGDDDSTGDNFLAAGPGDDKETQYNNVLAKKAIYDSINETNYINNSEYFEALTIAWGDYADALAEYDDTFDSAVLKQNLNDSITAYLNLWDEIEANYTSAMGNKVIFNDTTNTFQDNPDYFVKLMDDWEIYLNTLFAYEGITDADVWLNELNVKIINFQNEFYTIMERYNNTIEKWRVYDKTLSDVYTYLIDNPVTNLDDSQFNALREAWENYVDALVIYDNDTFFKLSEDLKSKINESIEKYIDDAKIFILMNDVKVAYDNYIEVAAEVREYLNLDGVIVVDSDYDFDPLIAAWNAYVDAWNAYCEKYDLDNMGIFDSIDLSQRAEDYLNASSEYDYLVDVRDMALAYNAALGIVTSNLLSLDFGSSEVIALLSAWKDYVEAFYGKGSVAAVAAYDDFESEVEDYFLARTKSDYASAVMVAREVYLELVTNVTRDLNLSGVIVVNSSYDFDSLIAAWDDYVVAWNAYCKEYDLDNMGIFDSIDLSQRAKDYLFASSEYDYWVDVRDMALAYNAALSIVTSNLLSLDFGSFEVVALLSAWKDYVEAFYGKGSVAAVVAYDDFESEVENYFLARTKSDFASAVMVAREVYLELVTNVTRDLNLNGVIVVNSSYDFDFLIAAWDDYVVAWNAYCKEYDLDNMGIFDSIDLSQRAEDYLTASRNYKNLANAINSKKDYDIENQGIIDDLAVSGTILPPERFDELVRLWGIFADDLQNYDNVKYNASVLKDKLNKTIEKYLGDAENYYNNIDAEALLVLYNNNVTEINASIIAGILLDDEEGDFDNLRQSWLNYVNALDIDDVDKAILINELEDAIDEYNEIAQSILELRKSHEITVTGQLYDRDDHIADTGIPGSSWITNGWIGGNWPMLDGIRYETVNSNSEKNGVVIVNEANYNITIAGRTTEWTIFVRGNLPEGEYISLNLTLYYQYKADPDGNEQTYMNTFYINIFDVGEYHITIATNGTGPDSINHVAVLLPPIYAPKPVFNPPSGSVENSFPEFKPIWLNPGNPVLPEFWFDDIRGVPVDVPDLGLEPKGYTTPVLPEFWFDDIRGVPVDVPDLSLEPKGYTTPVLPEFWFDDIRGVPVDVPDLSLEPKGYATPVLPEFWLDEIIPLEPTTPELDAPEEMVVKLLYPPFVAPDVTPDDPISTIIPKDPVEDEKKDVIEEDEKKVTIPEKPGKDKPPKVDAKDDESKDIVGFAKSNMKKTGLPIGILVALFMSILIAIRVKK